MAFCICSKDIFDVEMKPTTSSGNINPCTATSGIEGKTGVILEFGTFATTMPPLPLEE